MVRPPRRFFSLVEIAGGCYVISYRILIVRASLSYARLRSSRGASLMSGSSTLLTVVALMLRCLSLRAIPLCDGTLLWGM